MTVRWLSATFRTARMTMAAALASRPDVGSLWGEGEMEVAAGAGAEEGLAPRACAPPRPRDTSWCRAAAVPPHPAHSMKTTEGLATSSTAMLRRLHCSSDRPEPSPPTMRSAIRSSSTMRRVSSTMALTCLTGQELPWWSCWGHRHSYALHCFAHSCCGQGVFHAALDSGDTGSHPQHLHVQKTRFPRDAAERRRGGTLALTLLQSVCLSVRHT